MLFHQKIYEFEIDGRKCSFETGKLAAFGYRTLVGPGQHEVIGRFLRLVIDAPPGEQDARRFDHLRRARNQQRYDARRFGEADVALAVQTATGLFAAAVHRGVPHD